MLTGATARRYAEAVFEIGGEQNTVDRWRDDLRLLNEYYGDHRLAFILSEPNISFARKEQVVKDLLAGKVQDDALGLALLLVERGLVGLSGRIVTEYEKLYNEYHNQVIAELTTAMPIDDQMRDAVRADLEHVTKKKVILQERTDPSILGGAIARVGDTLIDGSVKRRLSLLRQEILRGGGSFGGANDGRTPGGDNTPPSGGPGGAGPTDSAPTGDAPTDGSPAEQVPFVVTPTEEKPPSGDASGGGSSATEMGPRRGPAPRMGPPTGNQNTSGRDRRDGRRNKGRRR